MLYVPGDHERALGKARTLPADALILDLEDAVAPEAKAAARARVLEHVAAGHFGQREVAVRLNGLDTPWFAEDLVAALQAGVAVLVLPKVRRAADLIDVGERIGALRASRAMTAPPPTLWAMIETPQAVLDAPALIETAQRALAARGIAFDALVFGLNDLARETRMQQEPGRAALAGVLASVVLAARAAPAPLDVIDGVCLALDDPARMRAEAEQARALGLDGKSLIHPAQIAIANEVFAPDATELAAARALLAAFEAPGAKHRNVMVVEGRMVERLHLDEARRMVALDAAIRARGV